MDIEALAKEARLGDPWTFPGREREWHATREQLSRFAALVAEAEREACAKTCEALWQEEATAAANGTQEPKYHDCIECAHAIRERSNVEHNRRPQGVRVDGPVGPHTKEQ